MPPEFYNKLFTMHATIMIFFVIIPLLTGAFGNFLIPLMIGARDMAFPKLNMFSYWFMPPAMIFITYSFFVEGGSAEAGWTSYPILTVARWATPGSLNGQTFWLLALLCAGISSLLGSINYITTIVMLRAPGMKMFRMPMTVWAMFITAILQAFALPVLTSALIMQLLDRTVGTNFFSPVGWTVANAPPVVGGGGPLLFQHLFWFYSHPAVYVMILPGMGMVSDIIATFSRKPLFGYKPMVFAIAGIAGLGFIVWGHHMFQSGMNPALGATFMLSTMMIALPSAIKVFNWLGTMWGGRIQYTTAMLNAMAFVAMFIIGGLSGIFMAATPVDMHIHDTYFIVGHIHYVLFGGSMFALFGAISFWFPKMFGRMMNERLGLIHFFLTFIFFNGTFFLMHIVGMHGHPAADRRSDDLSVPARGRHRRHEPVHDDQRLPARAYAAHLRLQLPLQPGGRAQGRRTIPGTPTRWNGRRPRRRRTTTSSEFRRSTMARTNTACRASRKTICRRLVPRPASAGPLDPVMA